MSGELLNQNWLAKKVWRMDRLSHKGISYQENLVWRSADDSPNFPAAKYFWLYDNL